MRNTYLVILLPLPKTDVEKFKEGIEWKSISAIEMPSLEDARDLIPFFAEHPKTRKCGIFKLEEVYEFGT